MQYRISYEDCTYVFVTRFVSFLAKVYTKNGVNWCDSPYGITYKADSLLSAKFN